MVGGYPSPSEAILDPSPGPAARYYAAVTGRWCGPVRIRVDDPAALAAAGVSSLKRLQLRVLAAWPAWLGPIEMHTTVAVEAPDEVVHTTAFRWRGVTLERSREVFHVAEDGASLRISGDVTGSGRIADDGLGARYRLRWWGMDVDQQTRLTPGSDGLDEVRITQKGPGFRSEEVLERALGG